MGSFLEPDWGNDKTNWSPRLVLIVATALASGSVVMVGTKLQSTNYNYNHSIMQSLQMFVGETSCLFVFYLANTWSPTNFYTLAAEMKNNQQKKRTTFKFTKLWMSASSLMDCIATALSMTSLLLISTSVNMMLSGLAIVTSCIVSRIWFKRYIYSHHALGCVLTMIGFGVVGYSSVLKSGSDGKSSNLSDTVLGIVLIASSTLIRAVQVNFQEYIVKRFEIPIQREVGVEGMFGMIWGLVLLLLFSFIPCPSASLCEVGGFFEDPITGTINMLADTELFLWILVTTLSYGLFNFSSINMTKDVSCVFSTFMSKMITIIIWVVDIMIGIEQFHLVASSVQLVGFVFLILGNVVYTEILVIRAFGFDKHVTKGSAEVAEGGGAAQSLGVVTKDVTADGGSGNKFGDEEDFSPRKR